MPNEVKLLPCDRAIADALSDLKFGMDFAYEQGLHEFGYDPVETVRAALSRPTTVVTDEVVEMVEWEISAWAFAHNIDGAIRNDLMARIRASMPTVVIGRTAPGFGRSRSAALRVEPIFVVSSKAGCRYRKRRTEMSVEQTMRKGRAIRLGLEELAMQSVAEEASPDFPNDGPNSPGAMEDEVQTSIAVSLRRIADAAELVASCVMYGFGDPPEFNTRARS